MRFILITGATGFLGSEVISVLMRESMHQVYALVRGQNKEEATRRLTNLWWERPELVEHLGTRIRPVLGDVTKPNLGLELADQERLIATTDVLIHCAAEVGITQSKAELWAINVQGTQRVLDFALRIQEDHPMTRLSHVSTAYVAGLRKGAIMEESLEDGGFGSLYEESKFKAEQLMQAHMDRLPISIFRPSQIVGHSESGRITTFNTLYYPLKLYLKNQLPVLPIDPKMKVNMVPVDYVAEAIVRITGAKEGAGKTFHLTTPTALQPTVAELLEAVRRWAKEALCVELRKPRYFSIPGLSTLGARWNHGNRKRKKTVLTNMLALAPYFTEQRTYDTRQTEVIMGVYPYDWQIYLPHLLDYATSKNFLNHNSRTAFEQVLFRLKSKRTPVTYYDVGTGGLQSYSGEAVSARIRAVLSALQAMGVAPGSRVAITGINSVSYFVLDAAIGLSGACSVPLYYTTPAAEIDSLLERSGAKWLFVGDERILSQVSAMTAEVTIVSFVEKSVSVDDSRVLSMDAFLALGKGMEAEPATVRYGDTATIRYTSGTTSVPKGVMFNHYQLRWMAETMASLLSWKSRNTEIKYLSFLPMSHVVEGILGAYTPYYMLSPVSVYYLNDFGKLVEMLPQVRPTIFFSVPRFYEKLWAQFVQSGAGKRYIAAKPGVFKDMLRPVVRKGLLKKAGLDHCDQLIAGSAPVSAQLLADFRELGIEVHNAYGLTEAPLITLNRLGDNELTNTGSPLPDTAVILAEDDEILVRGPQVSIGYDGMAHEGLSADGWLHTGDLGELTASGHLRIIGRKKEILITAYGKNINAQKVETRLRDIPGVSEAMLVGENRPFCTALIWLEEGGSLTMEALKQAIAAANSKLSHPEQIKRWAVMGKPLTIAAGELTPNLKLRRANIAANRADTIEALYQKDFSATDAMGAIE